MAHLFDLTPSAFAGLRWPAMIAGASVLAASIVAWISRKRQRNLIANVSLALGMAGFFFAANLAYKAFEPQLSSHALAMEMNQHLRPGDQIVLYGGLRASASIAFYTHRRTWLYNEPYGLLQYGAGFPDAPKIFLNDQDLLALWQGRERVLLVVPRDQLPGALSQLPKGSTWLIAKNGAKNLYANRPDW